MLNFGFGEIALIMVLAIVVVGPDRLPEMLRFLGKQYSKVMRASNDLRRAFMLEADRSDAEKRAVLLRERREQARTRAQEARAKALDKARERAASVGVTGDPPPTAAPAVAPEPAASVADPAAPEASPAAAAPAPDPDAPVTAAPIPVETVPTTRESSQVAPEGEA
jgi:sec-independent protein translocase protein TatB